MRNSVHMRLAIRLRMKPSNVLYASTPAQKERPLGVHQKTATLCAEGALANMSYRHATRLS